ncbi:MAG: flagellar M-ring protein FliF [Clostridiales bacterium]|nr:flagellar M-ring protein FliF [Clostridiales bacterium]
MNEQIKKNLDALKNFWNNASKVTKRLLVGILVAIIVIALVFSIFLNTKEYVVLFDQISQAESSEILSKLQDMGVNVKLDEKGSIMVLKEDESKVRMTLATEGYPKSGLSYYYIEQGSGMLTTDYERSQYVNIQLQERIAASIKTLDAVRDAIVTITIPNENVFYLQEKEKPSASVIIHMEKGNTLTESQVLGIQNLVVKSVSGLTEENVAITDSSGNDLLANITGRSAEMSKINITREIENDIKRKILGVLVGPYDASELRISVTASVDMDALVREETLYSPSAEGNNTGVISEESRTEESSSTTHTDGGVPGTSTNSEVPTYPVGGNTGESSSSSSSENIKYQVSQIISQFQKHGAEIESVTVGIAIDKPAFAPGERESIMRLVSHSVGINEEDITVENFVFQRPQEDIVIPEEEEEMNKLLIYGGIAAGVVLIALLILLITLSRRRKRAAELAAIQESQAGQEEVSLEDLIEEVKVPPINPIKDAKREEVKEFARSNPEIAAQMIRSWLKNDDD